MGTGSKSPYWVGFDLGGTKMMATVFDAAFNQLGRRRQKTRPHEGMKAGLARMVDTVEEAMQQAGVSRDELAGVGVGSPGPLDLDRGVILDTPNFGWGETPLRKTFEEAFRCPAVIANDVDAGVYGEYRFGAAVDARCVVGVFPGTGIGGGCVYEGRIISGNTLSAMEIGHMQVMPDGPLCGCGRRGCVEAIASRLAISAAAAAAASRGEAPHLLANAGTDLQNIRSGALAASIAAGDSAVEEIISQAAQWLGVAVGNMVNLFVPDVVVLGGGLVEALPTLIRDQVEKTAKKRVMPPFIGSFRVVVAQLGDDATVAGAAAWAAETIGAKAARKRGRGKE